MRKIVLSCVSFVASVLCCGVCAAQDAASLIPADASVVMRIHAGRIMEKAGGEELTARIVSMVEENASGGGELSLPGKWGVDTDMPIYLSITRDSRGIDGVSVAVAMNVSDAELFERAAQEMCDGRVRSRKGVSWAEDEDVCMVFDSHLAVVATVDGTRDAAWWRDMVARGGRTESVSAAEGFGCMMESDGDISVMVAGTAIDEDELSTLKGIYGTDFPIDGMSLVWELASDRGLAEVHYRIVAESAEAARYLEQNMSGLRRVEGRYADCIPASSMLVIYSAVDGGKIAEMMSRLSALAETETDEDNEYLALLQRLVGSLSGDLAVVLGVPTLADNSVSIPSTFMAQVSNRELMDFVVRQLGEDVPVEETGDGYVVGAGGMNVWMSMRDGNMVISTVEGMGSLPRAETPAAIKGCREGYGGFFFDMKKALSAFGPMLGLIDGSGKISRLLARIDSVESFSERPDTLRCTVRLSDGSDNLYRVVADAVADFMSDAGDDAGTSEE